MKKLFPEALYKIELVLSNRTVLVFILWALLLSFEYLAFGVQSYVKIHDNADVTLPLKLANVLSNPWSFSSWDPHQLGGTDKLTEVGSFDLLNFFFYVLPGWLAYGSVILLQRFVAGYFTFRLLTRHLHIRPIFALLPSLIYSMFSQQGINLQFDGFTLYDSLGLPAVPAVLFFLGELTVKPTQSWRTLLASAALGFFYSSVSFYAYSIFLIPLLVLWLFFLKAGKNRPAILLAFLLGWFALEAIEIVAALNYSAFSHRVNTSYCTDIGLWNGLTRATQRQFLSGTNLLPFLVGSVGAALSLQRSDDRRPLLVFILAVGFAFASVLLPAFFCSDLNPLAFLRGFNSGRFFLYSPFLTVVLLGLSLQKIDWWLRNRPGFPQFLTYLLVGLLFLNVASQVVSVKQATLSARLNGSNYANLFENPYLDYLSTLTSAHTEPVRTVLLYEHESQYNPGYFWAYGISTLDGYGNMYPSWLGEFWRAVLDPMMIRYPECRYGIRLALGETRLYLSNGCDVGEQVDLSKPAELFNFNLLSLASVKYVVSAQPLQEKGGLREIDTSGIECQAACLRYYIYQNPSAVSFLTAYSEISQRPSEEDVLEALRLLDLVPDAVLIDTPQLNGLPVQGLGASASTLTLLDSHNDDQVIFRFSSLDAKIVVLSSTYTPDWKVYIDGVETRVLRANYIFKAVYVPAGEHLIEFVYAPPYSYRRILIESETYLNEIP